MNYREAIDFLYSRLPAFHRVGKPAYKEGLGNIVLLDEYLNHPHRLFRSIHIAGTNGKGSVAHMLASVMQEAGFRTGLYTSPHLIDFRERIKVDGQMIPEEEVVRFIERYYELIEKTKPSFFELTVALAFDFFARSGVEVAVIEVGLGGRLDSTNIITPELSVITNISWDHTDLLGNTLQAIAGEKAGIIKKGIPVVISEEQEEVRQVFENKAKECSSRLVFASRLWQVVKRESNGNGIQTLYLKDGTGREVKVESDLLGMYQMKNIPAVLTACAILNEGAWFRANWDEMARGIRNTVKNTGLQGRWQVLGKHPLVVCDTGHNEGGLREVVAQIGQTPHKKLHFVYGTVNDKPLDKVLKILPRDAEYYFTRADIQRALDEEELARAATSAGLKGKPFHTVYGAFQAAMNHAQKEDLVLVGGSTFVVADLLGALNQSGRNE